MNIEDDARRFWPPTLVLAALVAGGLVLLAGQGWQAPMPHPAEPAVKLRGRVLINAAPARTLQLLPGIGPAIARNIGQYRQKHGPFEQPQALEAVPNIGPVRRRRLEPWIVFHAPSAEHPTGVVLSRVSAPR